MLTLSLIIPVYNEERHIRACLDAIKRQTVRPREVIVVDNNCTDGTIAIAKTYNFVRVVTESTQGRSSARNRGFMSAKGDIIGRIDADSLLSPNWTERVIAHFEEDTNLAALTGLAYTSLLPKLQYPKSTVLTRTYYWTVHALFGTITTWGGNMAVRRTAWLDVQDKVSTDDEIIHEDQDIALWLAGQSKKIIQANDVLVTSANQSFRYAPKFLKYARMRYRTKVLHQRAGNLPAPRAVRIPLFNRLLSITIALPFWLYGVFWIVLFLPIDFIAVQIAHSKRWFN